MRLINANELRDVYLGVPNGVFTTSHIITAIDECETVDAVPVVHGRWVMMDGMKPPEWHHHHQCSVCESYAPMKPPYGGREELPPWCPGCGARMDGETDDHG